MNSQNKSKHKALGLLLLAFIAPVVIAKLVLSLSLYHGGATNHGELINPETSYASLGVENPNPKEWQLLYLLPAQCDDACRERLYILRQSHTALGVRSGTSRTADPHPSRQRSQCFKRLSLQHTSRQCWLKPLAR